LGGETALAVCAVWWRFHWGLVGLEGNLAAGLMLAIALACTCFSALVVGECGMIYEALDLESVGVDSWRRKKSWVCYIMSEQIMYSL
jgi:hypothetical protein